MRIRDVMTTDVVSVNPDDRVADAAREIVKRHISGVFVIDGGKLVGKVSRGDVLQHVFPSYQEFYDDLVHNIDFEEIQKRAHDLGYRRVSDVMAEEVLTIGPNAPVMKAAAWMLLRNIHRLAVVDDADRLLGVVSRGDIFSHTIKEEMTISR